MSCSPVVSLYLNCPVLGIRRRAISVYQKLKFRLTVGGCRSFSETSADVYVAMTVLLLQQPSLFKFAIDLLEYVPLVAPT